MQDKFWEKKCGMFCFCFLGLFFVCMCVSLMKFCWQDVFREISNGLLNQASEKHWSQHQGVTRTCIHRYKIHTPILVRYMHEQRHAHTGPHTDAGTRLRTHANTHLQQWSGGKELLIDIPMFLCEQSGCCHYLLIQLHTGKLQGWEKKSTSFQLMFLDGYSIHKNEVIVLDRVIVYLQNE